MKKFKCPCCGQLTIEEERENEICEVCGWEDDWWDTNNPDAPPCCNWMTLNQAREQFRKTGINILELQKMRSRGEYDYTPVFKA